MAQDYAASVAGTHIRVTRLNADGTPATGANAAYVTSAFMSVSMTPEYEEGDEFTQKAADGTVCASFKAADTLKRVSLEVSICNPDPEFTEIIAGGTLLTATVTNADATTTTETVGWAAPEVGKDATPNGVAIEVWSKAIIDGKVAPRNPYFHWLFPYAIMRPSGDRVIENGMLANSFEGWGIGNAQFDSIAAPLWAFQTDRAFAYSRTASIPAGIGYQANA